ncbi:MAG: hypothetical protein JO363_19895 [Solirubrobacterales bacterium]|nr:hypothetical protein [Solirubrobacterales bacterium]
MSSSAARNPPVLIRLVRVLLTMGAVVTAAALAVSTGVVKLPFAHHSSQSSSRTTLAAQRTAANQQWASVFCTHLLAWKNEIQRDGTSIDPGLGPVARVNDAIAATTRALGQLDKLGLPPGQTAGARAEMMQLRTEIESRARKLQGDAGSIAGGNLGAIAALLGDLQSDGAIGTQIGSELQRVVSVDLGLSMAETRACRALLGIPI